MIPPGHVIVGGRKLAEMLTTTTLAEHVMVGAARIYGRGHDWQIVGERIYSRSEVKAFLEAVARSPTTFTGFIENSTINAMHSRSPYMPNPERTYRIESEGSSDNDWFRNEPSRTQAGGPANENANNPRQPLPTPLSQADLIREGENHVNASGEHFKDSLLSAARAYGRIIQGDPQSAIEEGANALENLCQSFVELWKSQSYFETANDFWSPQ